jgi:hypothetical protein
MVSVDMTRGERQDPFDPGSTPVTTFDCSYLNGFLYKRMPL